jgi:hypothetical protein
VRRLAFQITGIIGGLFLIAVVLSSMFPGHGPGLRGCQAMSINRIKDIAYLIQTYRQNHDGRNPEHLSQLADNSTVSVFYFSCRYGNTYMVTNADARRDFVDLFSPYRFLVLNDKRVVVCEQPGLWPDGTIGYCVTSADPANTEPGEMARFPAADFEMRLRNNFHEGAKTGSIWSVQYQLEGRDKDIQLSMMTPDGIEKKMVSAPYTSATYEFYKFQQVSFSAQHQSGNITATLLVNGKALTQHWTSGTNTAINWIVGSSCSY